jgi:hypothetical protein
MTFADYLGYRLLGGLGEPPDECASDKSDKGEIIAIRKDYFNSILRQLNSLREEVKRFRPPIKDYKIDAAAWNAEREASAPRKHWIDTVNYRKRDPWGSI